MSRRAPRSKFDRLRRHDVERAHDRDEEGKGGKRNKLHDWGLREEEEPGRGRWGENRTVDGIYMKQE